MRAAEVESTAELRAREVEEREQRALVRADGAEKRVASLEGELRRVQARAVELEGATAVLRDELGALRAESERLRGVVLRQHATIDDMNARGAQIVAKVDELFGDEDEDRSRRRR